MALLILIDPRFIRLFNFTFLLPLSFNQVQSMVNQYSTLFLFQALKALPTLLIHIMLQFED